MIISETLGKSC